MKKIAIFLVLAGLIMQTLSGCFFNLNPSESEKKEASQIISRVEAEISQDMSQIEKEISADLTQLEKDLQDKINNKESTANYQKKAEELSTILMETYGASTVQYALMDGNEIVLSNMIGTNDEWNKPVFCIGSSSKMYVTAAVMMLAEQGEIDLDTPVVQYMPEFIMADERYKKITPRMLLNHSSGFYGTTAIYGNSMTLGAPSTFGMDAFFEYKKKEVLKANPGEFSVYCNDGFIMSEFLVEKVSGITYTDFVKKNISEPLGLTYTTTAFDPQLDPDDITPMPGSPDGGVFPVEYMNYPGTGGIYSTTEEMCKFGRLFTGQYPELLSKKSIELTLESEFAKGIWVEEDTISMVGYGLGWDDITVDPFNEYGIRAARKGGDSAFHHADLTVLPDLDISIAVLSAGGNSTLNGKVSNGVLLEYLSNKGIIKNLKEDVFEPTAPVKTDMPEELKKYEGLYGNSFMPPAQIIFNDGEFTSPAGVTFVYTGSGEFTSENGKVFSYFKEESNGNTYLIQRTYTMFSVLGNVILEGHDFQKLEPQKLTDTVKSSWQKHVGKRYMCVNEIFNSPNYIDLSTIYIPIIDLETGYINGSQIIDDKKAVSVTQIPVMSGRDSWDVSFFESNGKQYLDRFNQIHISEEDITPFDIVKADVSIGKNGYAEWFFIDENAAGKEIVITIPEKGAVWIYNESDEGLAFFDYSIEAGEKTFTLPSVGFIVFAGDAETSFKFA